MKKKAISGALSTTEYRGIYIMKMWVIILLLPSPSTPPPSYNDNSNDRHVRICLPNEKNWYNKV